RTQPGDIWNNVRSTQGLCLEKLSLRAIFHQIPEPLISGKQEAAGATSRVGYDHAREWPHNLYYCSNDRSWCEVLPRTASTVLRIASQQTLINLPLHIYVQRG